MRLEQQVCTPEQGKRLKELGIVSESLFSYFGDEKKTLKDNGNSMEVSDWVFIQNTIPVNNQQGDWRSDVCCEKPIAPAFTVAELGVMLPCDYNAERGTHNNEWWVMCQAMALAAILIYLLENNHITAEECNQRLKA